MEEVEVEVVEVEEKEVVEVEVDLRGGAPTAPSMMSLWPGAAE